ncbi:MAG: hypothetical protein ACKVRP_03950 [Bacteroidota bacterium]
MAGNNEAKQAKRMRQAGRDVKLIIIPYCEVEKSRETGERTYIYAGEIDNILTTNLTRGERTDPIEDKAEET